MALVTCCVPTIDMELNLYVKVLSKQQKRVQKI